MRKASNTIRIGIIYLKKIKKILTDIVFLFYIAIRKFYDDECLGKASSLSYITILSVVPVIILIFALLSSYESTREVLVDIVNKKLIPYFIPGVEEVKASPIEDFSKNAYTLSILGVVFLLIAAVDIMFMLESSVNSIWKVKKGRSILQNFLIYWALLTIGPVFLVTSFYVTSKYAGNEFSTFLFPLLISWFGFFISFQMIPHTKVKFIASLISALIMAALWESGKLGFHFYMSEVANKTYGRIYGPLYIIPISIFWVYISYSIFLFGVELSYLIQYPEIFRVRQYKNIDLKNFTLFFILNSIYIVFEAFKEGKGAVSLSELANRNKLSRLQMDQFMSKLVDIKIIKEIVVKSKKEYLPLKPLNQIPVLDIVNQVKHSTQFSLNRGIPCVQEMFRIVMERLEQSKTAEFANLTYEDLLHTNHPIVLTAQNVGRQ